eukprot:CAMPEP_0113458100 /NCGR_PEP_ID=MMETSP0014_2-20120614/9746_1 /TAXON_ID=2857 /ORGANISM="Nitzschia sp." /LENGTH=312 /DNA_ID=CAMNT_0000349609 /DNA_START=488 /DNA_END=1426 /DNA_ORIENTATION=- /assembly_acc=CAM_ASM_000159
MRLNLAVQLFSTLVVIVTSGPVVVDGFQITRTTTTAKATRTRLMIPVPVYSSVYHPLTPRFLADGGGESTVGDAADDDTPDVEAELVEVSEGEDAIEVNKENVGNLVANDEWEGLTMELSALIRTAIVEDVKTNAREFLGKDEYKLGDFTKEIDNKIKEEVANLREKDEYEIGDLSIVVDEWAKEKTSELTGKPYETGDLSREIDKRVKNAAAEFCGKEEYQVGDLTKEMAKRVNNRLADYLGKEYEFGDITRQVENQRREWVKRYLGAEAAENYQFGDITKKALAGFVGKDEYQFGDVTKKLLGGFLNKKK